MKIKLINTDIKKYVNKNENLGSKNNKIIIAYLQILITLILLSLVYFYKITDPEAKILFYNK